MFVFSTYLHVFLLKFWAGELVGCGFEFRIQQVPTLHTFDGHRCPKNKEYLKKCDDHHGSRVCQKYAVWVLVGCRIKFCIQHALLLIIWIKTEGDMSKIRTKKVVFFMTNISIQPLWLTFFIEILLVLEFQLTRIYCWHVFL